MFEKKVYLIAAICAVSASVLMILFSDIAVLSAKKGIVLWTDSVLPAMLPFFICVNFMNGIGLIELLPAGIFPFVMSALSGYPMGAKLIGDMFRKGMIDQEEARMLLSYCSTSGPVFMAGAVGIGMLGSQPAGYVIAVSHYAGAIMNGIVYNAIIKGERREEKYAKRIDGCSIMEVLTNAIFAGFKSMAVILAYMIFFMFLTDLMEGLGVFRFADDACLQALMRGFVEMTVGCSSLTGTGCSLQTQCVLASIIISWGGLSILGQSMSMLSGTGISFSYLALTKFTHSIFAGIIALFLGNVML